MRNNSEKPSNKRNILIFLVILVMLFVSGVTLANFDKVKEKALAFSNKSEVTPTPTTVINIKEETLDLNEDGDNLPEETTPTPTITRIVTPTATVIKPTSTPVVSPKNNSGAYLKVDKNTSIGKYAPADIVSFDSVKVSASIVNDLNKLIEDAKKDGLTFRAVSGYRSYDEQVATFNYWVGEEMKKNPSLTRVQAEELANKYSARPGYSEHQLGTTVDLLAQDTNYEFKSDPNTKSAKWLEANASKYKFYISYKQGNSQYNYEPWHVRWYPEGVK